MSGAQDLFDALQSHALGSGLFHAVNTAEPKAAPGTGVYCAIWIQNIAPAQGASGLNTTTVRVEFNVRLYSAMIQQPMDMIDPNLTAAALTMMEKYSGDFGLSNITEVNVRAIDLMGIYGTGMAATAGYLEQDGKLFRVITITLPVIVNDLFAQQV